MELNAIIKSFVFHLIIIASIFKLAECIEQKVIIDLGQNRNANEQSNIYYEGNHRNFGNNEIEKTNFKGRLLTDNIHAKSKNHYQSSSLYHSLQPISSTTIHDDFSSSELKNIIRQMERFFLDKIEAMSKRVERLEANQNSFRRSVMAEWQTLDSNDNKRIRLFTNILSTWHEAISICEANTGQLLCIESAEENQQILELLRNSSYSNSQEMIYWIGAQTTFTFNILQNKFTNFSIKSTKNDSSVDDDSINYARENTSAEQTDDDDRNNFLFGQGNGFERGCGGISSLHEGKWMNRNCHERHPFICQL